ncbi:MAG: restriction endonuclease subunit S [Verrucomicrobiota bacterium]
MNRTSSIPLGDLMATKSGSVDPAKFAEEIFDLYSIPAFDRGEPEIVAGSAIGSAKLVVEPGDVLLSRIVPHIRRAWVVGKDHGRRIIASGEWIVFRSESANPYYLRQVLVGDPFHAQFMNPVAGVGGSLLRARPAHVAKIVIPLPPLAEQRWIAEVLDRAEALRAKRRAALAQIDSFTQSLFLDLFGDPATNPKGWPISLVADVQGGLQVTRTRKNLPHEVPYLRVANVYRGFLNLSEIKTIPATDAEVARTRLVKDDLLIVERHANPAEIGRGALWDGSISGCIHQNHIIRARFVSANVVPLYACKYLNSPSGRRHLLRAGKTTSGLNTISVSEVRGTPVALPPVSLQSEFARRVTAVEKLKTAQRASLAELDSLFATLQHRAFRGEL